MSRFLGRHNGMTLAAGHTGLPNYPNDYLRDILHFAIYIRTYCFALNKILVHGVLATNGNIACIHLVKRLKQHFNKYDINF